MTKESLIQGIENGKRKIKINRYEKKQNAKRLTRGVSDVVLEIDDTPYSEQLKESQQILSNFSRTDQLALAKRLRSTSDVVKEALEEQKDSIRKSLSSVNEGKSRRKNKNNYLTTGVEQNPETHDLYLKGKVVEENVLVEATYKKTNKREKTKIKDHLRSLLPTNQRTFKIPLVDIDKIEFV